MTILGCRAGMPANGQASSGYLVDTDSARILLDCGPGVATALSAVARPQTLGAVVISHLHLDHCYDLLPLGKSLLSDKARYPSPGEDAQQWAELDPVPLYVPAGGRAVLDRLGALFPVSTAPVLDRAFELAFDVREYGSGDRFELGELKVTLHELRHSAPNCGVRMDDPTGGLAYTGDTGVTPALVTLAEDADVLLAEATLTSTDHGPHGHLSATDAAQAAHNAGAAALVLTHLPTSDPEWLLARRDEAMRAFAGPVDIASPGETFDIKRKAPAWPAES